MPCPNHPGVSEGLVECWRCRRAFCANCAVELHNYFFCTDCKTAQVRDLLAGTDMFSMDYATMEWRFLAWVIDGFIKWGIFTAVYVFGVVLVSGVAGVTSSGRGGNPYAGLAVFGFLFAFVTLGHVLGMVYEALMLAYFNGQTLGKMAVGIRVVTAEGNPISTKQAWWRSIVKLLMFFIGCDCPIGISIDGIFALGTERASIHDQVTKTRVVKV